MLQPLAHPHKTFNHFIIKDNNLIVIMVQPLFLILTILPFKVIVWLCFSNDRTLNVREVCSAYCHYTMQNNMAESHFSKSK